LPLSRSFATTSCVRGMSAAQSRESALSVRVSTLRAVGVVFRASRPVKLSSRRLGLVCRLLGRAVRLLGRVSCRFGRGCGCVGCCGLPSCPDWGCSGGLRACGWWLACCCQGRVDQDSDCCW
jgi:hypothetical protein